MPGLDGEVSIGNFLSLLTPLQVLSLCLDPGFCPLIFTHSRFLFLTWVLTHCFLETSIIFQFFHVPYFSNPGVYFLQSSEPAADHGPGYPHHVRLRY